LKAFKEAFWALILPVVILEVFIRIFTPTESAGVACIYGFIVVSLFIGNLISKNKENVNRFSSFESGLLIFIALAAPFGWVITLRKFPQLAQRFYDLQLSSWFPFWLVFIRLLLGCFLSAWCLNILTPIFVPMCRPMDIY
jgi:C4-dicarboxylate transporter DctM subunit